MSTAAPAAAPRPARGAGDEPRGDPRVIFVVPSYARFGADFGALARGLARAGIPAAVYAPPHASQAGSGWDGPEADETFRAVFPPGTSLRTVPFQRLRPRPADLLRASAQFHRLADRHPDALFVLWTLLPIVFCGVPPRLRGRRCVFMVTGLGSAFGGETVKMRMAARVLLRLYRFLFSGPRSRVILHNHEDRDFLAARLRLDPARFTVTPGCGIDPEEFPYLPPAPPAKTKIIYAPLRLLKSKGVWDAVEASRILRERGVDHEMWFSCAVDPGNPSSLTAEEVRRIERENPAVRFLGWHPSTLPLYRAAQAVCVPTRYREGLPTVILEAASCGRPVVATDNVGCREFVEDGRTGLMVPPGSPRALADGLARVLEDEALARRLSAEAHRRFLAGFTKDEMVRRTFAVFRELGLDFPPAPRGA